MSGFYGEKRSVSQERQQLVRLVWVSQARAYAWLCMEHILTGSLIVAPCEVASTCSKDFETCSREDCLTPSIVSSKIEGIGDSMMRRCVLSNRAGQSTSTISWAISYLPWSVHCFASYFSRHHTVLFFFPLYFCLANASVFVMSPFWPHCTFPLLSAVPPGFFDTQKADICTVHLAL